MKEAFEEKAEENGHRMGEQLKIMFKNHHNSMVMIDQKLTELKNELRDSLLVAAAWQQVHLFHL